MPLCSGPSPGPHHARPTSVLAHFVPFLLVLVDVRALHDDVPAAALDRDLVTASIVMSLPLMTILPLLSMSIDESPVFRAIRSSATRAKAFSTLSSVVLAHLGLAFPPIL